MEQVRSGSFSVVLVGLFVIGMAGAPTVAKADFYETLNINATYTGLNAYDYPPGGYAGSVTGTVYWDETVNSIVTDPNTSVNLTASLTNGSALATGPCCGFPLSWSSTTLTSVYAPVTLVDFGLGVEVYLFGLNTAGGPLATTGGNANIGAYVDILGPTSALSGTAALEGTVTTESSAPEPGLYGLLTLGLAGLAAAITRRKKSEA